MDKHVCLFHLGKKLPLHEFQDFYFRICKVLGYTDKEISSYYTVYALQYKLFDGKPLSEDMLNILKERNKKRHRTCKRWCESSEYKEYNICLNACELCKLSPDYKNARVDIEDAVLCYTLLGETPSQELVNSSEAFVSKSRMCKEFEIKECPSMPFNKLLYDFINEYSIHGKQIDDYLESLTAYILEHVETGEKYSSSMQDEMKDVVRLLLQHIYRLKDSISYDMYQNGLATLSTKYSYTIEKKATGRIVKDMNNSNSTLTNKYVRGQTNLFDFLSDFSEPTSNTEPISNNLPVVDEANNKNIGDNHEESLGDSVSIDMKSEGSQSLDDALLPDVVSESTQELEANQEDTSPAAIIDESTEVGLIDTAMCRTDYYLSFGPEPFPASVITMNSSNSLEFSSDVLHSMYICIFPLLYYNREGFAIYIPFNEKIYFYDASVYGFSLLDELVLVNNIDIYTYHSFESMNILVKYGSKINNFIGIDICLCLQYSCNDIYDLDTQYFTNKNIPELEDMKTYYDITEQLSPKYIKQMRRMNRVYSVLLSSFVTSLCPSCSQSFGRNNLFQFTFYLTKNHLEEICTFGSLFCIHFPAETISSYIQPDTFTADMLLTLDMMPHIHQKKSSIMVIKNDFLCLFYLGSEEDALQFYDIFIAGVQKAYLKRTGEPLCTSSFYMIYH